MHKLRALVFGPGRAVSVLSFTEILAWGILIYPPVLIMPHLVADHGWSLAFGMAGFSIGLMTSGMLSPTVGHLIDRHGGNIVMSLGALAGALGLVLLTVADQRPAYLACWLLIGAAMSSTLYDPAFATLTRIFGCLGAPADHLRDVCRRVRLHRRLAGDAFAAGASRLARHLSDLCRRAGMCGRSAECLCLAAHGRRGAVAGC